MEQKFKNAYFNNLKFRLENDYLSYVDKNLNDIELSHIADRFDLDLKDQTYNHTNKNFSIIDEWPNKYTSLSKAMMIGRFKYIIVSDISIEEVKKYTNTDKFIILLSSLDGFYTETFPWGSTISYTGSNTPDIIHEYGWESSIELISKKK